MLIINIKSISDVFPDIIQLLHAVKVNIIIVHPRDVVLNKSDVLTKLVPQGNITVIHRSTNVMFHVCPEMYPFLHSGITILTGEIRLSK
jgi:hypothetical protein